MISSTTNTNTYICFLCTLSLCISFHCCSSKDSITTGESIYDGADFLESPSKQFQMGFFSHQRGSEQQRYLGIWYTMDPKTVVWVANRDDPVRDSTGVLTITEDGEAKVLDEKGNVYFNTTTEKAPSRALKLLDTGNAVLINVASGRISWQSFENPTDTFLPGMMMSANLKLTSWESPVEPGSGSFVFQTDPGTNLYSVLNGSTTYHWKSGKMSKNSFDENQIFSPAFKLLSNTTTQKRNIRLPNGTISSESYLVIEHYSRLVMNHSGKIQYFSWPQAENHWVLDWQEPKDDCSVYRVCGSFGMCSASRNGSMCSCLPGFERTSPDDNAAGCKRTYEICQNSSSNDTFIDMTMISIDDTTLPFFKAKNESACIKECLKNCRCLAYSYISQNNNGDLWDETRVDAQGCWFWDSEPNNLQNAGAHNISFRYISGSSTEPGIQGNHNPAEGPPLDKSSSFLTNTRILVFGVAILVILLLCILSYTYYKRLVTREQGSNSTLQTNSERRAIDLLDLDHSREDDIEGIGVPFFQFETILVATDNFSDANKLGQGGFGPVYKGKLPGGLEVAVKRLSSLSGQGLEEFRNEVILIAKLQHRNLVRLLGYSMKGNEKTLLYEYMPNKSLDAYIFDREPSIWLNWGKRYAIIIGIARGLLYLHQDSRLRIIHRDLKTSNILLDEELNPKISDFGLAKIVKDREMEASTNRVIGTYGYMAPEYALDGLFSIKSDVFSFGVVVLEIISGRKNTGSSQSQQTTINLLGYAWSLWKEDRPFELMDRKLAESSNSSEVLKCIIVGLLCVQEDPGNRPTMTNVVLMLAGDIASLPTPKQPAFVARRTMSSSSSSSYKPDQSQTNNTLTISLQEGR